MSEEIFIPQATDTPRMLKDQLILLVDGTKYHTKCVTDLLEHKEKNCESDFSMINDEITAKNAIIVWYKSRIHAIHAFIDSHNYIGDEWIPKNVEIEEAQKANAKEYYKERIKALQKLIDN